MIVTAPASSANLGPGFDCLALALDLPFHLAVGEEPAAGDVSDRPHEHRWHDAEATHPAVVAFGEAGGDPSVPLRWASPIPPGRGLGYSGAARVAGAFAAGLADGLDAEVARAGAHAVAARLEGHPDNSAASAHGGFTVAVGERVTRLEVPAGLVVVVWSPSRSTATDASRRALPGRVTLDDAAFTVARAAAWVAAIASGDLDGLEHRPDARAVRDHLLGRQEVLAAWLSGSGPSVAALVPADLAPLVAGSIGGDGAVRVLDVHRGGVEAV